MELLILEAFQPILKDMSSQKYPTNKLLRASGIGYITLLIMLAISKSLLPNLGEDWWSDPPIFDYILLLGIGICISITTIAHTYYSWTMTAKEFTEWLESQPLMSPKMLRSWYGNYYEPFVLWSARLMPPVFALVGILMIGFMLLLIFELFFG